MKDKACRTEIALGDLVMITRAPLPDEGWYGEPGIAAKVVTLTLCETEVSLGSARYVLLQSVDDDSPATEGWWRHVGDGNICTCAKSWGKHRRYDGPVEKWRRTQWVPVTAIVPLEKCGASL